MYQAIGDLLPIAVGVAISPLPIIALIILLMSPQATAATPPFVVGWMVAICVALAVFTFLSDVGLGQQAGPHPIAAAVKTVLGLVFLYLAYREWRACPAPGKSGELPHWLSAVQNTGPLPAAGMGFVLYVANPKNLTLGITAGVTLAAEVIPMRQRLFVALVYLLIGASTVLLPMVAYLMAGDRMRPWLDDMREWLTQHNAALMAALLAVIGSSMLGKGIAGFS